MLRTVEAIIAALLLFGTVELFLQKEIPLATKFEVTPTVYVEAPSFVRTSSNVPGSFRAFVLRLNITGPTYVGCLVVTLPFPIMDYTGDGIEDIPDVTTFMIFLDGEPVKFDILNTKFTSSGIFLVNARICPKAVVREGTIEVVFDAV